MANDESSSRLEVQILGSFRCSETISTNCIDVSSKQEVAVGTEKGIYIVNLLPLASTIEFCRHFLNLGPADPPVLSYDPLSDSQSQYLCLNGLYQHSCRQVDWSPCGTYLAAIRGDRRLHVFEARMSELDMAGASGSNVCLQQTYHRVFELSNFNVVDIHWHRREWADGRRFSVLLNNSDVLTFRVDCVNSAEPGQFSPEVESLTQIVAPAFGDECEPVALAIDSDSDESNPPFGVAFASGQVGIGLLRGSAHFVGEPNGTLVAKLSFVTIGGASRRVLLAAKRDEIFIWRLRVAAQQVLVEPEMRVRIALCMPIASLRILPPTPDVQDLTFVVTSMADELRMVRFGPLPATGDANLLCVHEQELHVLAAGKRKRGLVTAVPSSGGMHLYMVETVCNDSEHRTLRREATLVRLISFVSKLESRTLLRKICNAPRVDFLAITELSIRGAQSIDCRQAIEEMLTTADSLLECCNDSDIQQIRVAYLLARSRLKDLPIAFCPYNDSQEVNCNTASIGYLRQLEAERRAIVDRYHVRLANLRIRALLPIVQAAASGCKTPLNDGSISLLAFCSAFLSKFESLLGENDTTLRLSVSKIRQTLDGVLSETTLSFWRRAFVACPICQPRSSSETEPDSEIQQRPKFDWLTTTCYQSHTLNVCPNTLLPLALELFQTVPGCARLRLAVCRFCTVRYMHFDFALLGSDALRRLAAAFRTSDCFFCTAHLIIM